MIERIHQNEFEALRNAKARHRSQMQGAWEQAGVNTAFESVRQAHLARKRNVPGRNLVSTLNH
jgi:hypothetical protein